MKTKQTQSDAGFTLVEILIASFILAVGLLATSTMIARSTIQDSRAYYLTKATMLIEEILEQESNKQYMNSEFNAISGTTSTALIDGVSYNISCTVTNATPEDFCKQITCVANWNNKGKPGNIEYAYTLCKYD